VLGHIKALRKNLHDGFYQLGIELKRIQEEKLYDAKGFSSFEVFAERELELGKATALNLRASRRVSGIGCPPVRDGGSYGRARLTRRARQPRAPTQELPDPPQLPLKPPR